MSLLSNRGVQFSWCGGDESSCFNLKNVGTDEAGVTQLHVSRLKPRPAEKPATNADQTSQVVKSAAKAR